jgi:hypothetical protein
MGILSLLARLRQNTTPRDPVDPAYVLEVGGLVSALEETRIHNGLAESVRLTRQGASFVRRANLAMEFMTAARDLESQLASLPQPKDQQRLHERIAIELQWIIIAEHAIASGLIEAEAEAVEHGCHTYIATLNRLQDILQELA